MRSKSAGRPDDFADDFTNEVQFASGTGIDREVAPPRTFAVTIHYREPEFEARLHRRNPNPYRWTYRISACDREAATRDAIVQFEDTARNSSVGWRRDIVSVEATPLDVDDPAR